MYFNKKFTSVFRVSFVVFLFITIFHTSLMAGECRNFFKDSNIVVGSISPIQIKSALTINAYVPESMYLFSDPYKLESTFDLNTYMQFFSKLQEQKPSIASTRKLLAFDVAYEQAMLIPKFVIEEFTPFAKVLYENRDTTSPTDASYFNLIPSKRIFAVEYDKGNSDNVNKSSK